MKLEKIISGAQTGVDQGAMVRLWSTGFPAAGGGRRDEDGVIPERYPVKELKKGGFKIRRIQNLQDADGTLIHYFGELEEERRRRCVAASCCGVRSGWQMRRR